MTELFALLMSYVSIWAPSLTAILGIALTVVLAMGKVKSAIETLKADKTLADLYEKVDKLASQNTELTRCNKLLLDRLTKIQDYADNIKKED